jgi:MFS transporter, ACS family, allantoate permease
MSFPEDTIQLCSVIIAGIASQVFSNFRCGLMIITNTIVLIGAVLVDSKFKKLNWAFCILTCAALPDSNAHGRLASFYSKAA